LRALVAVGWLQIKKLLLLLSHVSGSFLVSTPKFYEEDYSHTNNEFGNAVGLYFHFLIRLPSFKFRGTVNFIA
jgi:hypothetical protein